MPFAPIWARHFRVEITQVEKLVPPMQTHGTQSHNTRSREAFELVAGGVLMRGVMLFVVLPVYGRKYRRREEKWTQK